MNSRMHNTSCVCFAPPIVQVCSSIHYIFHNVFQSFDVAQVHVHTVRTGTRLFHTLRTMPAVGSTHVKPVVHTPDEGFRWMHDFFATEVMHAAQALVLRRLADLTLTTAFSVVCAAPLQACT